MASHSLDQAHHVSEHELVRADEWMGPWAVIRQLQYGDQIWFRGVTPNTDRSKRQLIGYSQDLRQLAMHFYKKFLHIRGTNNGPISGFARRD